MIEIKHGNLFDVKEGIICHQVNALGVMGAGIAAEFKKKFPNNYKLYMQYCNEAVERIDLLGKLVFLKENDNLYSCSMFAQYRYGRDKTFVYTDYDAFERCCREIAYNIDVISFSHSITINMPYKIGCGLANGNWNIIYKIIEEVFKDYHVILWKII